MRVLPTHRPPAGLTGGCRPWPIPAILRFKRDKRIAVPDNIWHSSAKFDLSDAAPETKSVRISVPAGTQSGTRIAMEGKGVPRLRGSGRGQLGVTLLVQTPTRIDDDQRDLLRQLAELRDETRPEVTVQKHSRGVFGRLRDAFAGQ